jgi:pyruvate/2-oxoglutarate dehydrogenase complex dihydrolipoamide dehydrogenase (E3) component
VDVVVVGMGPGGEDVAGRVAEAGLEVVGVESTLVGGECPYWGCVPSKMMIRAAGLLAEARRVPGMAGTVEVSPDYAPVAQRIRQEATDDWDDTVAVDRFVGKGGTFVRGTGRLAGPGRVQVGDQVFTARRGIVLATGTQAAVPPVDGLAGTPFWTNRQAIEAEQPPRSLIVLGGGAVGLELAQSFARFGADVTVVEAADRLLPLEEPEAGALLADVLTRDGLTVRVGAGADAVRHDSGGFTVTVGGQELTAERLLVATGRRADLGSLGLDSVGLDPSARWLEVDEHLRAAPGLWGVGDLTGRGAFTHVAMYQSQIAVRSILGEQGPPASYHALPRVTFTDPEVGAVGLTQAQAQASGLRVRVGTSQVPSSARGWIHKAGNDGFITLVEDTDRGVLVGATCAGPNGGEILGALAVAVHAAVPTRTLQQMIYAYPTFHRGIEDALRALS